MELHKSQVFFYILVSFMGGVFLASLFSVSLSFILAATIIGISIIFSGFRNKYMILSGFLVLAGVCGLFRYDSFNSEKGSLTEMAGSRDVILSGFINSEPVKDGTRIRFAYRAQNDDILVTTNAFPERKFGDELELKGKIQLPANFSDFDYITYLKKEGIRTVMPFPVITPADAEISRKDKVRIAVYKNIFTLKNKFQEAVNASIPEPNASFVNGILLGSRQNIPDDLTEAFKTTGTTHILAISGYNITIISEILMLGLVWFFRRRISFWISVVIIIFFVILTGASASVVRAAVMGLILSFANGYGRIYDQKNSLIMAGAVMVWLNPFLLLSDIGFQLSFAAVLGLVYLYPYLDSKLNIISKMAGMKELTLMTISAQVAVAPLLLYYFGYVSVLSLPANILILPMVPAAMLLGFITGLSGMFTPFLGKLFGYIAWAITTYQIEIIKYLSTV